MKVLYVENILHVNNFLPKKLEPYLAFLWEKLHVHYVNKKSWAVSTFMLMIFNVMQPKLAVNHKGRQTLGLIFPGIFWFILLKKSQENH